MPLKEGDLERAHPNVQQQLQLISAVLTSLRHQACESNGADLLKRLGDNYFFLYHLIHKQGGGGYRIFPLIELQSTTKTSQRCPQQKRVLLCFSGKFFKQYFSEWTELLNSLNQELSELYTYIYEIFCQS